MPSPAWRFTAVTAAGLVAALLGSGCGSGSAKTASRRSAGGHSPAVGRTASFVSPGLSVSGRTTKHYASGTNFNQRLALSLGFNVMDIAGSQSRPRSTKARVDALPRGVQALIYVGNLDNTNCTNPPYTMAQFRALVDAMASDRKVYGYYIADEPHPLTCTHAVADIRARADYLHARSGFQKAFIVIEDGSGACGSGLGCEFRALQPATTHVDLIGLDPYPCHYDGGKAVPCNYSLINQRLASATRNGIPLNMIVPVFQVFGQEGRSRGSIYYRTPRTSELATILRIWKGLVPSPAMDYAYTFSVQCSTTCPAPQALANHPELQGLMQDHNG